MALNQGDRVRLACGLVVWVEGTMQGGTTVTYVVGEDELVRIGGQDCPSMHVPHHDGWYLIVWLVPGKVVKVGATGPSRAVRADDPTAPPGTPTSGGPYYEVTFAIP